MIFPTEVKKILLRYRLGKCLHPGNILPCWSLSHDGVFASLDVLVPWSILKHWIPKKRKKDKSDKGELLYLEYIVKKVMIPLSYILFVEVYDKNITPGFSLGKHRNAEIYREKLRSRSKT